LRLVVYDGAERALGERAEEWNMNSAKLEYREGEVTLVARLCVRDCVQEIVCVEEARRKKDGAKREERYLQMSRKQ
jgi:hypothetical protein